MGDAEKGVGQGSAAMPHENKETLLSISEGQGGQKVSLVLLNRCVIFTKSCMPYSATQQTTLNITEELESQSTGLDSEEEEEDDGKYVTEQGGGSSCARGRTSLRLHGS